MFFVAESFAKNFVKIVRRKSNVWRDFLGNVDMCTILDKKTNISRSFHKNKIKELKSILGRMPESLFSSVGNIKIQHAVSSLVPSSELSKRDFVLYHWPCFCCREYLLKQ